MRLTDHEKAMLDGAHGAARQKAMDLLLRYGNALGAERLVETRNVAGTIGATTPFMRKFADERGGLDAVFSEFNLDSAEVVAIPPVEVYSSHLQQGIDPEHAARQGVGEDVVRIFRKGDAYSAGLGVQLLNTCTPYQVGNLPARGEHCAWMESSAVIYINAVLGARSNAEGRESTGAAMLTGRIPYWGYHIESERRGTHLVELDMPVESMSDWGMLGYYVGDKVQDKVPVIVGAGLAPSTLKLKHFGAAAASSGAWRCITSPVSRPRRRRPRRPSAATARARCSGSAPGSCGRPTRISMPRRATPTSISSCWAAPTTASSRSGRCAGCCKASACTRTRNSGSSRLGPPGRSPTRTATRASSRKPAAT